MLFLLKSLIAALALAGGASAGRPAAPGNPNGVINYRIAPNEPFTIPANGTYGCILADASQIDVDAWIKRINVQQAANEKYTHHSVLYGVPSGTVFDADLPEGDRGCPDGNPWGTRDCMAGVRANYYFGDVIQDCYISRSAMGPNADILFATQRNNPDFDAPEGYGIPVGPQSGYKYFMLQQHYHVPHDANINPNRPVKDASHLKLQLTTEEQTNIGVLVTGNIVHRMIELPAGHTSFTLNQEITGAQGCKPGYPCAQTEIPGLGAATLGNFGLFEQFVTRPSIVANGGIEVLANGVHFHGLGRFGRLDILRDNGDDTFTSEYLDSYQSMGHMDHTPNYHPFAPGEKFIRIGDGLNLTATYSTVMRGALGGFNTNEEMFLDFMLYAPAQVGNPTIRAFSPCTYCNGATGGSILGFHPAVPETVQQTANGDDLYCHPGAAQLSDNYPYPGYCDAAAHCHTQPALIICDPTPGNPLIGLCFCPPH